MAQDNALVAEQLKVLTQMMTRRAGVLAMDSDEGKRPRRTIRRKVMPEVSRAEVSGALAARRPAGALFPATAGSIAGERSAQTDSTPAHNKNRKGIGAQ